MPTWQWCDKYDDLLKRWRKYCAIHMWLQMRSYYLYSTIDDWLTYPVILLSTASSIGIFSTPSTDCASTGSKIERYVMGSLALLAAVLASINKHNQSADKAYNYQERCREYQMLIRKINYILAQPYEDRNEVAEVVTEIRGEIDKVTNQQRHPPRWIIRAFNQTHQELDTTLYEDLEQLEQIKKDSMQDTRQVRSILQRHIPSPALLGIGMNPDIYIDDPIDLDVPVNPTSVTPL